MNYKTKKLYKKMYLLGSISAWVSIIVFIIFTYLGLTTKNSLYALLMIASLTWTLISFWISNYHLNTLRQRMVLINKYRLRRFANQIFDLIFIEKDIQKAADIYHKNKKICNQDNWLFMIVITSSILLDNPERKEKNEDFKNRLYSLYKLKNIEEELKQ